VLTSILLTSSHPLLQINKTLKNFALKPRICSCLTSTPNEEHCRPARFVVDPSDIPDFQYVEQAEDFLANIAKRSGAGELELQAALDISTLVRNWIIFKNNSIELELKVAASGGTGDQRIFVEGGLPRMPGPKNSLCRTGTKSTASLPVRSNHFGQRRICMGQEIV
jgi:hypothetical protein